MELFMDLYNRVESDVTIAKSMGLSRGLVARRRKLLNLPINKIIRTHSLETKIKMSNKRKKWLTENPDKHPWRNKDKFQSVPCENIKRILLDLNITFTEEYQPKISNRHFSIDIAFPDKLIALEINGNQHYDRDGKLKKYYQEREDILTSNGWTVYQIHYSHCFDMKYISELLAVVIHKKPVASISTNPPILKESKHCLECNSIISTDTLHSLCMPCWRIRSRKVQRPSKDELNQLIWSIPITQLAKRYSVSDKAIHKWCKSYEISKPPQGFWGKKLLAHDGGIEPHTLPSD